MNKFKFKLNYITALLLIIVSSIGCGSESGDPFNAIGFDAYDSNLSSRVKDYHIATTSILTLATSSNPSLYIDFSDGIQKAFKEPVINKLISDCFNSLYGPNLTTFRLGDDKITQLSITNSTALGELISDSKNYKDKYAPIQKAVEEIANKANDALIITDFEEVQKGSGEILKTAYLKESFTTWIAKGNTIHFFVADYAEGKVNKHIYFTLFIVGSKDENNMLSKLNPYFASLPKFELSNQAFNLNNKYPSAKMGGNFYDSDAGPGNENILDLKGSYVNGLKNDIPFEFCPFGLDWATIYNTHESYIKNGQFDHFFRNLFLNLSNEDSYIYEDFEVKVTDVTDDFLHFAKCTEALNHKPKIVKGTNGEDKFSDDEMDDIALYCYDSHGKIKSEWEYTNTKKNTNELPEVFLLNQELFKNTKKDSEKKAVELGILFDPKFKVENIANPDCLMRVDIILVSAKPNISNPLLENFKWINSEGETNLGLYQSIKTTLEEPSVVPTNKVIYSYFIKTLQ